MEVVEVVEKGELQVIEEVEGEVGREGGEVETQGVEEAEGEGSEGKGKKSKVGKQLDVVVPGPSRRRRGRRQRPEFFRPHYKADRHTDSDSD